MVYGRLTLNNNNVIYVYCRRLNYKNLLQINFYIDENCPVQVSTICGHMKLKQRNISSTFFVFILFRLFPKIFHSQDFVLVLFANKLN